LPFKLEIKTPAGSGQKPEVQSVSMNAAPGSEGSLFLAVRDNHTGLLGTLRVPLPVKDVPTTPAQATNSSVGNASTTKPEQ